MTRIPSETRSLRFFVADATDASLPIVLIAWLSRCVCSFCTRIAVQLEQMRQSRQSRQSRENRRLGDFARVFGGDSASCPFCDASAPGEWDEVLHRFVCPTCSRTWVVKPPRPSVRISSRAIRRAGDLLAEFQNQGARTDLQLEGGGPPKLTQRQAAEQAGMSKDQEKAARNVANVADEEFEAAVEREYPATVTDFSDGGHA
jgi:hypothetical protein